MAKERVPSLIAGVLHFADLVPPFPALRVRLKESRTLRAETVSSRHGLFAFDETQRGRKDRIVEVVNAQGVAIATADVPEPDPSGAAPMRIDVSVEAIGPQALAGSDSLVNRAAAEALLAGISNLIDHGTLAPEAREAVHDLLRPLLWLEALADDTNAVLDGDTEAAERFRVALLSTLVSEDAGAGYRSIGLERPPRYAGQNLVNDAALVGLIGGTIAAGRSAGERVRLQACLSTLLRGTSTLEHVAHVLETAPGAMRPLLYAPFGPPLPDFQPSGPSLPDFQPSGDFGPVGPDIPEPKLPKTDLVDIVFPRVTIPDLLGKGPLTLDHQFGRPLTCFDIGGQKLAEMEATAPRWQVHSLSDPVACAGFAVTLNGTGFGWAAGEVLFQSATGGTVAVQVLVWTDKAIMVLIPPDGIAGEIRLRILFGQVPVCGIPMDVYRPGESLVTFDGGIPAILSFVVPDEVEPGQPLTVSFTTNSGPLSGARLQLMDGSTLVEDRPGLPGGSYTFTFQMPATLKPLQRRLILTARSGCGRPVRMTKTVRIQRHPDLSILGVEVVQAIQRWTPAGEQNTVPFCARRRTAVRAYLTSGLWDSFDYGSGANVLPDVSGTVRIWRDGHMVTALGSAGSAEAPPAGFFNRLETKHSLTFLLPSKEMYGAITIDVEATCSGPAASIDPVVEARYSALHTGTKVTFQERPRRRLAVMLVADQLNNRPAPTMIDYSRNLRRAQTHNPIPENGFDLHYPPGFTNLMLTGGANLGTFRGWEDLVEGIEEIADDSDDNRRIWAALVPFGAGYRLGGLTKKRSHISAFGIDFTDVPAVLTSVSDSEDTFSHEMGHAFGFDHSPCEDPGGSYPLQEIDNTMPGRTEEIGFDAYTSPPAIIKSQIGELMSYCDAGNRWPSIEYWRRMFFYY